jgi:shikimate dehydrogenase
LFLNRLESAMSIDLSSYTTPKLLLGLIGLNIMKSLSPAMHQAEGVQHGLNVFYHLIDLANFDQSAHSSLSAGNDPLPNLFHTAQQMGFAGLNITYPCKQAVIPLIDEVSPDAASIGAVNTVVFKNGKSYGYNTDCSGYSIALKEKLGTRPLGRVVLVGAGGAGAAVAHGIMALGATHLTLVDTDVTKAQALAVNIMIHYGADKAAALTDAKDALEQADGLVNATPIGMAGIGGMCVPAEWIQSKHWVSDVVYSPLVTPMLQVAQDKGCTTIGGDGMNLWQAVKAFELFTGKTGDVMRMGQYHKALFAHRGM